MSPSGAGRAQPTVLSAGRSFDSTEPPRRDIAMVSKGVHELLARRLRVGACPRVYEAVPGTGRRDIEQPAFLVDGNISGRWRFRHELVRKLQVGRRRGASLPAPLGAPREEHDRPLEALRAVSGEQDDTVFDGLDARQFAALVAVAEHAEVAERGAHSPVIAPVGEGFQQLTELVEIRAHLQTGPRRTAHR